ncbi:MAG: hypothetical protein A3F16_03050 [Deltaproteobacteria bacterium RIFCSPHIGHO2_12_FULL_43_9]|nr:MAG: hypothetical protein A3F16_03050 [Deltaproteobacteria bacterium RIFCSPHIGHO2_12_FULL_43_9]
MAIIVIAFIAITNSIIYSQMSSSKSRKSIIASYLAAQKLAEFNMKFAGKSIKDIPAGETGNFPAPHEGFSWDIKSQNFEYDLGALATSMLSKEETQSDQIIQLLRNLSESMKESIKEVTITVLWTSERRPRKYSLTSLFMEKGVEFPSLGSFIGPVGGEGGGEGGKPNE